MSSPPGTTSTAGIPPFRQADNLLDARSLLLLLQGGNLLPAVPPLLLAELKRLGLDLLDGQCLRLNILPAETGHQDFLPLGGCAYKELATRLKWLPCLVSIIASGSGSARGNKNKMDAELTLG